MLVPKGKNEVVGATWLEKAAKQGDADAQALLADLYERGGAHVPFSSSIHVFQKVAEKKKDIKEAGTYPSLPLLSQEP